MIPLNQQESCLNTETPVGGEWGKIWIFSIINKHHSTPCHATPRHATPRHATPRHATPRHTTPRHAKPFLRFWAYLRLPIVIGKWDPLDQYVVYHSRWSQQMKGVRAILLRGSDSTINSDSQALHSLFYDIHILTEFGVKPLMCSCFEQLFVQSKYYITMENDIPQILTHIGPPNSS